MPPIALNSPIVMQYPGDVKNWILVQDFHYTADITIPRGFVTDFASIPCIIQGIIKPTDLGDTGPLVHDWKYRNGIGSRASADKEFLRNMEKDEIPWWKRHVAYAGVRVGGWMSWNSGKVIIEQLEAA